MIYLKLMFMLLLLRMNVVVADLYLFPDEENFEASHSVFNFKKFKNYFIKADCNSICIFQIDQWTQLISRRK